MPLAGKTSFEDQVYGQQERDYAETEDLVLLRSDGHPLYNLAVICDDIEMQITHVIRGQDHLTNTHKQILIYEALGVTPPTFAHLPLIMAPNKGKLSKRKHGEVVSMTTYRDAGFVAAAFRNFLALLGWSAGEEKEIYTLNELIEKFSLDGIHPTTIGQGVIAEAMLALPLPPSMMLVALLVVIFLLGWPLEWPAIVFIFLPIFLPVVTALKLDLVWFCTLVAVCLQTAFLSPPVAMAAYYLKAVAPKWELSQIYRGMFDFMLLQMLGLAIVFFFPETALWLPEKLFGK